MGKSLLRQSLVDDGHFHRARRVLGAKAAAAHDGNAHGLKESVADYIHVLCSAMLAVVRLTVGNEVFVRHAVRDVGRQAGRHALHAGQSRECLLKPLVQLHVFALVVAQSGGSDLKEDEVVGAKACVDFVEHIQRAQKRPRANHLKG